MKHYAGTGLGVGAPRCRKGIFRIHPGSAGRAGRWSNTVGFQRIVISTFLGRSGVGQGQARVDCHQDGVHVQYWRPSTKLSKSIPNSHFWRGGRAIRSKIARWAKKQDACDLLAEKVLQACVTQPPLDPTKSSTPFAMATRASKWELLAPQSNGNLNSMTMVHDWWLAQQALIRNYYEWGMMPWVSSMRKKTHRICRLSWYPWHRMTMK